MGAAAKHLDPVVGIDMHMVILPAPAPPVMLPIPFAGYLIDPNDYGSCKVRVNGFPPARAGTPGIACPPHIPPGVAFLKPPTNECEMHLGSSVVVFAGDAAASQGNPVLTCHDVGMPAPARAWRKAPTKSLMMAVANVLPIPGPSVVMIGGAPTITMAGSAEEPERKEETVLESVELHVFDAFGEPLREAKFELHLPNGDVEEDVLDHNGRVTVRDVPAGWALFVLPTIDEPESPPVPPNESWPKAPGDAAATPAGRAGSGALAHVVAPGETFRGICLRYGVLAWRDTFAENGDIRDKRCNPNVLLPGDIVNLTPPDVAPTEYRRGGTSVRSGEATTLYVSPLVPIELRLLVLPPTAVKPITFELRAEAHVCTGTLGEDGVLRATVPMRERIATVRLKDAESSLVGLLRLHVGHLDPHDSALGVLSRLRNLGHLRGDRRPSSVEVHRAMRRYQTVRGLETSGYLDGDTSDAIREFKQKQ